MVNLYQSQTVPINPAGVEPILSVAQVWEVLSIKVRKPGLFVKPIASANILEDSETSVKREVIFREGMGPPGGRIMVENVTLTRPWKADYQGEGSDGAFISNMISQGRDETDLYLTYYFKWPYPALKEGSLEAQQMSEKLWGMAKETVQHTVDLAREMVKEGKVGSG